MAKRALYSRDDILSAAISSVGRRGHAATVADVTHELGAPSGSIYHRFPTRESLFASAWIRCVHQFHDTFATITDIDDPLEAIVETGLLIPRFCRENPDKARTLTLYRHSELLAGPPKGLIDDLTGLNDPVVAHISELTRRRFDDVTPRSVELVALACRETPYGMVRGLIGGEIPAWLDQPIAAAITAVASLDPSTDD